MSLKRLLLNYLANIQMKRAIKSSLYIRNDPKGMVSKYGPKYLDLGCGSGYGAVKAANDGIKAIAVDIDKNAVSYMITLKKNYTDFLLANGERLPFKDNTFDVVYSNHVLEHIPDDNTAIRELSRVLRRGGGSIDKYTKYK